MSEVLKNPETTPQISKNNPDALAVHPQIQTRYMQNIAAIAKQWNDRFVTETSMQIGGESYGKKENDKQVPDLNSDFWINYANKSIEQQMMSLVNQ